MSVGETPQKSSGLMIEVDVERHLERVEVLQTDPQDDEEEERAPTNEQVSANQGLACSIVARSVFEGHGGPFFFGVRVHSLIRMGVLSRSALNRSRSAVEGCLDRLSVAPFLGPEKERRRFSERSAMSRMAA